MTVDCIVVGQGISGTFLSWYLLNKNLSFVIIDNHHPLAPSRIAAGIINPVTGRRMVRVWMAEEVLSFAHRAYTELGRFLALDAITNANIIDFFPNPHQRQVFMERLAEGEEYLSAFPEQNQFNAYFNYELGCGEIKQVSIAHLETLLPAWRKKMLEKDSLIEEEFDFAMVMGNTDSVHYKNISARKLIFCDGLNSFANPLFRQLPFAPNKGEALLVEINELPGNYIYKKGFLLAPYIQPNIFWLGSNYQWEFSHDQPSSEFHDQATNHLSRWLKVPFTILDHKASVRPATLERRPFVGWHPWHQNIGILNGMGTKGCSLAPYFANQLVQNLTRNEKIDPMADITRFKKILSLNTG